MAVNGRTYLWVRVDVACLTPDGAVVGVGWWPVPDVFRALAKERFIADIRKAVKGWWVVWGSAESEADMRYVKCSEARMPPSLHRLMIRRWGQRPPESPEQIWPTPNGLPLPIEVCYGER